MPDCGLCVTHTLHDAYHFIKSLQHRGREATGIAAIGDRIDVIKWEGPVSKFEIDDLYKIFRGPYHSYMAHVRYATRGRKDKILFDAHPQTIGGKEVRKGDHIIIRDCELALCHNGQVEMGEGEECDSAALLRYYKEKGEYEIIKNIPASYTVAIADKKRKNVIVLRDRTGIKPGVLGIKDGKYCMASEDIAFKQNSGEIVEEIEPGSIYYLSESGYKKEKIVDPKPAYCFFEWNYLAHKDSIINGISVSSIRKLLGEKLAKEFNPDADIVTFLPRCPETAARSYAAKTGKPFYYVFYKMRGERAFQGSTEIERANSIKQNLNILDNVELKGKKIIVIDDSMIRGNNSRRARELLIENGVERIYWLNYTPPIGIIGNDGIGRGCMFGVDMPPNDNFIARGRTAEEISQQIGMDVRYISIDGMLSAYEELGIPRHRLCTYCIGGPHPYRAVPSNK
jgi:amidophosphoribosyltransferase